MSFKYTDVFKFDTDNLVLLEGPVNQLTGATITSADSPTSVKCRFFDDAKDSLLIESVSSGTTLTVDHPEIYVANVDSIVVWLNDGTWHDGGFVTAVDRDAGTVTITTAIPSLSSRGNRVCRRVGNAAGSSNSFEVDMTYYEPATGAVAGNYDYGWYAIAPDAMSAFGMDPGRQLRIEVILDVTANVKLTEVIHRFVSGGS